MELPCLFIFQETVKNVPPQLAPVLMTEISARLQAAPERALATSRWLRTTLQYHSAPLAGASHQALETYAKKTYDDLR